MALLIPRIEWKEVTEVGDSVITSDTLINMADTSDIEVGMIASGLGVVADSTVLSKTANSVTLSEDATSNNTAATYTFFWRYDFEYPPVKDTEFVRRPKNWVATSLSGLKQVQTAFLEGERDLEFWFLTQADADLLRDNWYIYAYKGFEFRYFPDKAVPATFFNVELNKYEFKRIRQVKKYPGFKYSLAMSIAYVVE